MAKKQQRLKNKLSLGYSLARSAHFTAQQFTLPLLEALVTRSMQGRPALELKNIKKSYTELYNLLKKDTDNIDKGLYPLEVLYPESFAKHALRFPQIVADGVHISRRRRGRESKEFNQEAREYLADLPEYYQRNFHYQSGGYLTEKSAELYEHQVEILFAGAADAMRRLIIPLAKDVFLNEGEGLRFLEVAAGTGRLTRFMKLAFPKAQITVLDLSEPYLKQARKSLAQFRGLDFVQGAAEELPFKDNHFDFVYSCFLFHELPADVRDGAVLEGLRVLKPGGFYGFVDSLQKGETEDLNWALEQFPKDFHEPFYKNYLLHPMEDLLRDCGFSDLRKDTGFFSKAVLAQKPFSA
ncbi:class I SAM-dependent methyltransferase [Bdellovibrio sp. SKB1291214]|uniref:class I SAM-dependent methyltransferase n=1 Tax=Bdellovibrio sp. SKB1291214 TaxID=1732569 RepID=UPI0022408CEC|nr:class I SAM-dependent methyltransferase [Bdellovibrio sp. SKB1291214]UYL07698.1 class I SAM-dependent methyltransferase [Bdellovibrio sp. SKB1291214]